MQRGILQALNSLSNRVTFTAIIPADFSTWCASHRLQLNADKTEVIWVGSKHNLAKLQHHDVTVTVGTEAIQPVDVVRNLGVWMDRELSMKQHVIKVAGACFHQLRHLRQIRRRVGREVTTRLVLALVISRLDYCKSVLAGLPASTVNILQRVQNVAARLISQLKQREHVTPSFQQLHWLPVKQRVQYKLCTIMYVVQHGLAPSYITKLMTIV